MNKFIFSGFISSDIKSDDIKLKSGESMKKVSFNIACQRKTKDKSADFPRVTALGKNAENIERFFTRGQGIEVTGHVQTGSYEGKNGKVYTTDHIIDEFEFAKVRKSDEESTPVSGSYSSDNTNNDTHTESTENPQSNEQPSAPDDNFMNIPDDLDSEIGELPFR